MPAPLSGKTFLITGGSGGIAGGCAHKLAADGAALLLMARSPAPLEARREELRQAYPEARVECHPGDACKAEDVKAAVARAHALQGSLDGIVAVAGGGSGYMPLLLLDDKALSESFDKNVVSVFLAIKYGVPLMRPGGAIVCISSTAAKINFTWLAPYCAAKAAIESLVRSAAEELAGAGIRVNAVRPGLTRAGGTGRRFFPDPDIMARFQAEIPLLRPGIPAGEPDDIGGAVRYLLGPESSWVTGQSFAVDGGNELRKAPDLGDMVEKSIGKAAFDAAKRGKPVA